MFNQFNQGAYGMYPQGGMQYSQMPVAKMTQVLSPEQIKQLRSTSAQFSLQVDPIEITRSLCTHKDNGKIALMDNNDGTVTCAVCGAKFKLVDWESQQVQEVTNMFIDILQSIKTYYLDISENYVTEYFKMIPLLEKVPKFYELALHNFRKYEQGNPFQQNGGMYGFNMLNAIAGPGMMNPGMMGGGMMPQGAPGMMPQGMMNPAMMGGGMMPQGAPMMAGMAPNYNGFVNNGGYMPNTNSMVAQEQPQQGQAQGQQQTQQNQGQTVQTTKMFNL